MSVCVRACVYVVCKCACVCVRAHSSEHVKDVCARGRAPLICACACFMYTLECDSDDVCIRVYPPIRAHSRLYVS